jgi:hypothetical protein
VELPFQVGAPLKKRPVGRQSKNRIKGCLEGGSGGSKSGSNVLEMRMRRRKND